MNRDERRFWREAFLAAELPTLFRKRARFLSPTGAAHLAADFADAALTEYRRRIGGV